ncbi:MAG: sugar ABC transporter permease [Bacilli bacterium]|nr:sugar ABC transporter permease [Bacilli bacterium]
MESRNLEMKIVKRAKRVNYSKYGYIFIAPFFIVYFIFLLIPLLMTFYYSFFEYYHIGLEVVGPKFIWFDNYIHLFREGRFFEYLGNTLIIWIVGFIPQIVVSLLLALIFTSYRLKIRGKTFFKTVIYMPNLIMASAFAMLFFLLFGVNGPINQIMIKLGLLDEGFRFLSSIWGTRGMIAGMNFLMWFGNTTILLMAGINGIDQSLFEAAEIDGANSWQVFWRVTMPLLSPIMLYVFITSLIGGLQMFDVPDVLTRTDGGPNRTSMTVLMYLNQFLKSKNYGDAGAISVVLFIFTALLSILVFLAFVRPERKVGKR